MQEGKKKGLFLFSSCTLLHGDLLFADSQSGLLAKMNPETGEICYCDTMEGFIWQQGDVIDFIQTYANRVYALEMSGGNLVIFDFDSCKCTYVPLGCDKMPWGNFAAFERYHSKFYIFSKCENKILVFDDTSRGVAERVNYFDGLTGTQCICRENDRLWILPQNTGKIGVFDLRTENLEVYELGRVIGDCVDAVAANGDVYILNRYGIIYKWSIAGEKLEEIMDLETEHEDNASMCRILYVNQRLLLFPALGEDIKIWDLVTGKQETYHGYPPGFSYYHNLWSKYYGYAEDADYYYIAMRLGNYLLKIRKRDAAFLWIKPKLPAEEEKLKQYYAIGKTVFTEEDISVKSLAKAVLTARPAPAGTGVGSLIYEKVKI